MSTKRFTFYIVCISRIHRSIRHVVEFARGWSRVLDNNHQTITMKIGKSDLCNRGRLHFISLFVFGFANLILFNFGYDEKKNVA